MSSVASALNTIQHTHNAHQDRIKELERENHILADELEDLRQKIGDVWADTPGCGEAGVDTFARVDQIGAYVAGTLNEDNALQFTMNRLTSLQGSLNTLMITEFKMDPGEAQRIGAPDKLDMLATRLDWRRTQLTRAYQAVLPGEPLPEHDDTLEVLGNYIVSAAHSLKFIANNNASLVEQRDSARRDYHRLDDEIRLWAHDAGVGSIHDSPTEILTAARAALEEDTRRADLIASLDELFTYDDLPELARQVHTVYDALAECYHKLFEEAIEDYSLPRQADTILARLAVTVHGYNRFKDLARAHAGGFAGDTAYRYNLLAGTLTNAQHHRRALEHACAEVGLTLANPDLEHQLIHSIRLGTEAMEHLDRTLVNTIDPADLLDRETACNTLIDQWNAYAEVLSRFDIQQASEYDTPQEALRRRLNRLTELETVVKEGLPHIDTFVRAADDLI